MSYPHDAAMLRALPLIARSMDWRQLTVWLIVVALHGLAIHYALSGFSLWRSQASATVSVSLQPLPPTPPPEQADSHAPAPPQPASAPPPERTSASVAPAQSEVARPSDAGKRLPSPSASGDILPQQEGLDMPGYPIAAPPTAALRYSARAQRGKHTIEGNGLIRWLGSSPVYFRIEGMIELPSEPKLAFVSEGEIVAHGLSPFEYRENRDGETGFRTQFGRESNSILFSGATHTRARARGEQDIASVIWQLAGMGRHDRALFQPDASFRMVVADRRDAQPWIIRVIVQEAIDTPIGTLNAWHLQCAPTGSTGQMLDIWLAPEHEWYPVKLRLTEPNGDVLDLTVQDITSAPDT